MRVDKSKWQRRSFYQLGNSQLGKTLDSKKNKGKPYPYLCAFNIGYGSFNLSSVKEILLEDDELERYLVKKGDLLICEGGDTGRCAIWDSNEPIYYQNALHRVRFNFDVFNKFVMYAMHYYKQTGIIDVLSHGQTIKHLTQKGLSRLYLSIPTFDEQQAIAAELDAIQVIIDGYKAQIADLDALAQSIFLDMFGDPVSNPKGWEITVLNDLCTKITDGTHLSPKWVDSGIPFIFVANIKNFEINFDVQKYIDEDTYEVLWKSTPIELGDIVYSSVGSYGNPAIVSSPQKFMFQRHIALLKPLHDKINNVYLKWFLISEGGKKQADDSAIGVAQKTLNLKAIKNFHIPVPPIELQQPFASKVEAIEKQKELIRQQLADAETLMKERMQYYFS